MLTDRSLKLAILIFIPLILATNIFLMQKGSFQQEAEVLDCRNSSFVCNYTHISERPSGDCNKWNTYQSREALNCSYTKKNLKEVSFIADSNNYIDIPQEENPPRVDYTVKTGKSPWDLEFLPSGNPIWTNKGGYVHIRKNNSTLKIEEIDTIEKYEAGLLGLAIDPNFSQNRFIYLYYTAHNTSKLSVKGTYIYQNRISRFKLENQSLDDERILLDVPGSRYHSGGRLEFGPDEKLYATTGDANQMYKATQKSFLGGKIIHLNTESLTSDDAPKAKPVIYSLGHRNPQGLAWSPEGGKMFNTEHGPWRTDEINHVKPNKSYGWSGYSCNEEETLGYYGDNYEKDPETFYNNTPPVRCFKNWTMAPSGATIVDQKGHPWHGDLFVAGLRGKQIFRWTKGQDGSKPQRIFYTSHNQENISLRMRDVEFFNGSLYAVGDRKGLVKLSPRNYNNQNKSIIRFFKALYHNQNYLN